MKLLENLYWYEYVGWENNCNTVVIKDKTALLIDPGHSWNIENLLEKMREDGIYPKDVNTILNTHSHPDHCESNELLLEITKAKIVMHEFEASYLENEAKKLYEMFDIPIPDFTIDHYLGDKLEHDGIEFQIIHTPGHSPGSICLYWRENRVLICGDLIFENSFGRTDLPGGDPMLIKESIDKISKFKIDFLLPGHGRVIKGSDYVANNFNYISKILKHSVP